VLVEAEFCAIMESIKILLVTFAIISLVGFAAGDERPCKAFDYADWPDCMTCCQDLNMKAKFKTHRARLGCHCKEKKPLATVVDSHDPEVDDDPEQKDWEGDEYRKQEYLAARPHLNKKKSFSLFKRGSSSS
jgi:hypothetical protein